VSLVGDMAYQVCPGPATGTGANLLIVSSVRVSFVTPFQLKVRAGVVFGEYDRSVHYKVYTNFVFY